MSRRDRILSLAIGPNSSNKNNQKKLPAVPLRNSTQRRSSTIKGTKKEVTTSSEKHWIITNIDDIWSRPYSYDLTKLNDEYANFVESAPNIDLSLFKTHMKHRSMPRESLVCYESLDPFSDEEDQISPSASRAKKYFGDSDDSVKDKHYLPTNLDSDTDSSTDIPATKIVVQADVHVPIRTPCKTTKSSQPNNSRTVSREPTNIQPVPIVENSDSRLSTDIIKVTIIDQTLNKDDINTDDIIINNEDGDDSRMSMDILNETIIDQILNEDNVNIDNLIIDNNNGENNELLGPDAVGDSEKGYTKSGLPRKRRQFEIPLKERKRLKKLEEQENLSVKPACSDKCRKKCSTYFTETMRANINKRYVLLNSWEAQGLFIKGMVDVTNIKTRTVNKNSNDKAKRNVSYKYYFYADNVKINVCKTFFLTTLGYHKNNDRRVHNALEHDILHQKDLRGTHIRKNLIDRDQIREHINSFGPAISHYRREHAPKKLYLPSDIKITLMYSLFLVKFPGIKVSYEVYRVVVKEMNISFACLGNEECEVCATLKPHVNRKECSSDCEKCIFFHKHREQYRECRIEYKADVKKAESEITTIYYSVDLQKVILLPRMEQYKSAIFSTRLVTFNESFVPLGPTTSSNVPFAALWNESISGRNQEDIISAMRAFFINKRDAQHIVLWADNCAAQNKNWALMSFLVQFVNNEVTSIESITIKYFEPGHTFMSADHFHHQVELAMDQKKKIYDYDDFVDCVRKSNSMKNYVKLMFHSDFYNYSDMSSQHKLRAQEPRVYLRDLITVKAEKGEFSLKYKNSFKESWQILNFLQVKIIKNKCFPLVTPKNEPRGIKAERKAEICSKLVPLMPESRQVYWRMLPTSDAANLTAEY